MMGNFLIKVCNIFKIPLGFRGRGGTFSVNVNRGNKTVTLVHQTDDYTSSTQFSELGVRQIISSFDWANRALETPEDEDAPPPPESVAIENPSSTEF